MSHNLELLDAVVLTEDVPERDLRRGHVGTIVEVLAHDTYEVEFSDDDGRPYAIAPLKSRQLLKLRTAPRPAR